ncbi:hypothetical protein H0H81_007552 [Sphagnurus paluster]|uniref:Uncharacterized protein n=1 Tax=Sphagnurus paluster TaxID=117069 RepID=A0A9P7K3C4_9AGAR|nr:hypothetical protein H0H81_007552 [Sphagnurus paluster]
MQRLDKLGLHLLSLPLDFEESPETVTPDLPTPLPWTEDTTRIDVHTAAWDVDQDDIDENPTPSAPVMKDLDSFTEGTGRGSFDSVLDEPFLEGDLFCHPQEPQMVSRLSIDAWRREIVGSPVGAPSMGPASLPEDPIDAEAMETAESLLDGFNFESEELEDVVQNEPLYNNTMYNVSARSALATASTPCVMKRARPGSPGSQCSRRIRPRSKSLSSIRTSAADAPWLGSSENYKRPFD